MVQRSDVVMVDKNDGGCCWICNSWRDAAIGGYD
jgi:hypothetical protein